MIRIVDGCIVCGLCEAYCPQVFDVLDDGAVVLRQPRAGESDAVQGAIEDCPVSVIVLVEDGGAASDVVEDPAD